MKLKDLVDLTGLTGGGILSGIIATILFEGGKLTINKLNEKKVRALLKKGHLEGVNQEFGFLYILTVKNYFEKTNYEKVIYLLKDELIINLVFKRIYHHLQSEEFTIEVNKAINNLKAGEEVSASGINGTKEIEIFFTLFIENINNQRTPAEAEQFKLSKVFESITDVITTRFKEYFLTDRKIELSAKIRNEAIFEKPSLVNKICYREENVNNLIKLLDNYEWVNITSGISTGKSILLRLISEKLESNFEVQWISLRGKNEISFREILIELLKVTAIKHNNNFDLHSDLEETCKYLKNKLILFLDDLPDLIDDPFKNTLNNLFSILSRNQIKIISSSQTPIKVHYNDIYNIFEVNINNFSAKEILELLNRYNAPNAILNDKFIRTISILTKGNPVLLRSLFTFLEGNEWNLSDDVINEIFSQKYSDDIKTNISKILLKTVKDENTLELIFRLEAIGFDFSEQEVNIVSEIAPSIIHHKIKLSSVLNSWIEKKDNGKFFISPLLKNLGKENLNDTVFREVHKRIGKLIINTESIDQFEGTRAILHFYQGSDFKNLSGLFIHLLNSSIKSKVEYDLRPISALWSNSSLPDEIPLDVKVFIRTLQVTLFIKTGKNTDFILMDLDNLLTLGKQENNLSKILSAFMVFNSLVNASFDKASKYYLYFMRNLDKIDPIEIPEIDGIKVNIGHSIWFFIHSIRTIEDIKNWLNIIQKIPEDILKSSMSGTIYKEGSKVICDKLITIEFNKPQNERNWQDIIDIIDRIFEIGINLDAELLVANSIAAKITIFSEGLNDIQKAEQFFLENDFEQFKDSCSKFTILASIANQFYFLKSIEKAIPYLEKAIELETDTYPISKFNLLLKLNSLVNNNIYAEQAIKMAQIDENLDEDDQIRAYIENAIKLWESENKKEAFLNIYKGYLILKNTKNESKIWKSLFVLFTSTVHYFSSQAQGNDLKTLFEEKEFFIPKSGSFIEFNNNAAELFHPSKEICLDMSIIKLAELNNFRKEAFEIAEKLYLQKKDDPNLAYFYDLSDYLILSGRFKESINLVHEWFILRNLSQYDADIFYCSDKIVEKLNILKKEKINELKIFEEQCVLSLLPIIFYLSYLKTSNHTLFNNKISEIYEICNDISENIAFTSKPWKNIIKIIQNIFNDEVNYEALIKDFKDSDPNHKSFYLIGLMVNNSFPLAHSSFYQLAIFNNRDLLHILTRNEFYKKEIFYRFFIDFWIQKFSKNRGEFKLPVIFEEILKKITEKQIISNSDILTIFDNLQVQFGIRNI